MHLYYTKKINTLTLINTHVLVICNYLLERERERERDAGVYIK